MNWDKERNTKEAEGFKYFETPYGAGITGYTGTQKRLAIPETLNGKPVKYIEGLKEKGLSAVRIPNTVTTIGDYAFSDNQLTSVVIPDSVTTIGNAVFNGNKLTSIIIPDSLKVIEDDFRERSNFFGAFAYNQLVGILIPDSVKTIGNGAFAGNKLISVTIPAGVTSIGEVPFSECTSLKSLDADPRNISYRSIDGVIFDKADTTLVGVSWGEDRRILHPERCYYHRVLRLFRVYEPHEYKHPRQHYYHRGARLFRVYEPHKHKHSRQRYYHRGG